MQLLSSYIVIHSCLSSDLSGAIGLGSSVSSWNVGVLIGLVWAVNGDLDGDFTSLDLLGVHLVDSLLLHLLGGKSNEAETTSLAGFVAGLKLLDHETGDWSEGDLGRGWLVSSEELLKLRCVSAAINLNEYRTYLFLRKIVWQIGNHNLVLGWDTVGWRTTLATLTWLTRRTSSLLLWLLGFLCLLGLGGLVGGLGQRKNFSRWDFGTFLTAGLTAD